MDEAVDEPADEPAEPVARTFSLREAQATLTEAGPVIAAILACRVELAERLQAFQRGERHQLPEVKALEARLGEHLDWFTSRGVQVKGYAPLLLDWPHEHAGRLLLLCWLENEPALAWYHEAELGFLGRRPLSDLA